MLKGETQGQSLSDQGFYRCPFCGRDVEQKIIDDLMVSEETLKKISENAPEGEIRIIRQEVFDPVFNLRLDDLTMKPINGMAYYINLYICRRCIAKISFRHKFKAKHQMKAYATKTI